MTQVASLPSLHDTAALGGVAPRREVLVPVVVHAQSQQDLLHVVRTANGAASRKACTAGNNRAIKIPMIAITTSNSTSVKPPYSHLRLR